MALTNAAAAEIGASNFLMETIANDRVGPTIFKMHWTRHPLKHSKFHLLTSDRPIIMPVGLADQRAYIALPASVGRPVQTALANGPGTGLYPRLVRSQVWAFTVAAG
jgi:hypothetical protein